MTVDLKLTLPDALAEEARRSGLLTSSAVELLIRETIRQKRVDHLFESVERLHAIGDEITGADLDEALRAARRQDS
jgi:post-segregation antitoxin (ccd killing protein)